MPLTRAELRSECDLFLGQIDNELTSAKTDLEPEKGKLEKIYCALASVEAWRVGIIEKECPTVLDFYVEGQNDLLVSFTLATQGMWRPSLISARGAIENIMYCLYFKDHQVELTKWGRNNKLGFQFLCSYFEKYFIDPSLPAAINPIEILKTQYAELSLAVHASSKSFRMTIEADRPQLFIGNKASLGRWSKNVSDVIKGINLLLILLYKTNLQGTSHTGIREALGYTGVHSKKDIIRSVFNFNIPDPI